MRCLVCRLDAGLSSLVSLATLLSVRHLHLQISNLPQLQDCSTLMSLQWLELQCDSQQLPADLQGSLSSLTGLRHLQLACDSTQIPGISSLHQLTCLQLSGCQSLQHLPGLAQLTQLQTLDLSSCSSLTSMPDSITSLSKLCSLDIRSCKQISRLRLHALSKLSILKLSG